MLKESIEYIFDMYTEKSSDAVNAKRVATVDMNLNTHNSHQSIMKGTTVECVASMIHLYDEEGDEAYVDITTIDSINILNNGFKRRPDPKELFEELFGGNK